MKNKVEKKEKSISIGALEGPILNGNYREAELVLSQVFKMQMQGKMNLNLAPGGRELTQPQSDVESYQVIEKLATLLTVMLGDPNYVPSPDILTEYLIYKRFLTYLFSASSYQNTDHIVVKLGLDKKTNFDKNDIIKFLVLYMPESGFNLPWHQLVNFMPSEVCRAYLGLMTTGAVAIGDNSAERLNNLASLAKALPVINSSAPGNLEYLSSGYFHISNFTGPEKNEFKSWAVKNYKAYMDKYLDKSIQKKLKQNIQDKKKQSSEKPTIVVIHEMYRFGHAMYRCYHSLIIGLQDKFNVVAIGRKGVVDDKGKQDAHKYIEVENIYDLNTLVGTIADLKPDVVLYPSIGMSNYTTFLATQRLAPVQCMCPGHPSSSYFDEIDYFLYFDTGRSNEEVQRHIKEKTVSIGGELFPMPGRAYELKEKASSTGNTVKVVVNGVIQKVTNQLLKVCQEITEKAEKPVEFQFFMNNPKQDLEYFAAQSLLRRNLPNSVIHPAQDYNGYMNVLNQCDFAIPTVPFGGSNSNMDCLILKLPKLFVVDDSDYVGFTDHQFWHLAGCMEGYCESIELLVERAVEFVNDDSGECIKSFKEALSKVDLVKLSGEENVGKKDPRLAETILKLM